nr:MAG TPA: hypothetical protein [Bacteriophage sp.]
MCQYLFSKKIKIFLIYFLNYFVDSLQVIL